MYEVSSKYYRKTLKLSIGLGRILNLLTTESWAARHLLSLCYSSQDLPHRVGPSIQLWTLFGRWGWNNLRGNVDMYRFWPMTQRSAHPPRSRRLLTRPCCGSGPAHSSGRTERCARRPRASPPAPTPPSWPNDSCLGTSPTSSVSHHLFTTQTSS